MKVNVSQFMVTVLRFLQKQKKVM